jgi:hypothetical protein
MDRWQESLGEEVSEEHERSVLQAAGPLLRQNAELAAAERAGRSRWWLAALPALGVVAVAVVLVARAPHRPPAAEADAAFEIALDYDLIRDVHEIENLELLQKLGDPERWPTKRKKPGRS